MKNYLAEQIRERVTVNDLLMQYGLQKNRRGFVMCPFHDEDTPSLGVFADGKAYNCFGCGAKGDIFSFTMALFNITFPQALVRLDTDFSLGLYGYKADPQILANMRAEQALNDAINTHRENLFLYMQMRYKRLCRVLIEHNPKHHGNLPHPQFHEALHERDWLEYWLLNNL